MEKDRGYNDTVAREEISSNTHEHQRKDVHEPNYNNATIFGFILIQISSIKNIYVRRLCWFCIAVGILGFLFMEYMMLKTSPVVNIVMPEPKKKIIKPIIKPINELDVFEPDMIEPSLEAITASLDQEIKHKSINLNKDVPLNIRVEVGLLLYYKGVIQEKETDRLKLKKIVIEFQRQTDPSWEKGFFGKQTIKALKKKNTISPKKNTKTFLVSTREGFHPETYNC